MLKRVIILFSVIAVMTVAVIFKLYVIVSDDKISNAAFEQNTYKLNVVKGRGTIYDCNNVPLTNNGKTKILATVTPTEDGIRELSNIISKEEMQKISNQIAQKKPFVMELGKVPETSGLKYTHIFQVNDRYNSNMLCEHMIGYTDSSMEGVSGLESSFNDYLKDTGAEVSVSYKVSADGNAINGETPEIKDSMSLISKGVSTTIDSGIQKIAEEVAPNYIKKGAVLISEVPSCKIRAMLSLPQYNISNLGDDINRDDSPFLNRTVLPYSVGSVFKLVTAATALEYENFADTPYNCVGHIDIDGKPIHCFDSISHGVVGLENAIAQSCNCYFVNLSQSLKGDYILSQAKKFGFGKKNYLASEILGDAGTLPGLEELSKASGIANFSFGQGSFTATPIQITAMINTIASDGVYTNPKLLDSLVDSEMNTTTSLYTEESQNIISYKTANTLKKSMSACVIYGTGMSAQPEGISVAAKTGTAQTGQYKGDTEITQCWFAGFFPLDKPKYVITVLEEDGTGVAQGCSKVFKDIVERLVKEIG